MSGPGLSDDLPVGRRMAYWRRRRGMSQQVFADRIGKSKSWVDKCERGIRQLDKVSVLREIADALRISLPQLVGAPVEAAGRGGSGLEVESVRAVLTRYEVRLGRRPVTVPGVDDLERRLGHAWMALGRADYDRLLRALPELLVGGQWCRADGRDWRAGILLGQAYQVAAEVLHRVGVPDLAWLAADRALAVGAEAGDPLWAARAAGPLAAVLREAGRPRYAFEVCLASAHRLAGPNPLDGGGEYLSVYGTLLLHAALAAAAMGHPACVGQLLGQARDAAAKVGAGRDHYRTCFGPGLVGVVGVAAQVELGYGPAAVDLAADVAADGDYQRLPPAVRARHLIDVARAQLQVGDAVAAGRAVVAADEVAALEVRARPAVREVLGAVLRQSRRPQQPLIQLAESLGITV